MQNESAGPIGSNAGTKMNVKIFQIIFLNYLIKLFAEAFDDSHPTVGFQNCDLVIYYIYIYIYS